MFWDFFKYLHFDSFIFRIEANNFIKIENFLKLKIEFVFSWRSFHFVSFYFYFTVNKTQKRKVYLKIAQAIMFKKTYSIIRQLFFQWNFNQTKKSSMDNPNWTYTYWAAIACSWMTYLFNCNFTEKIAA